MKTMVFLHVWRTIFAMVSLVTPSNNGLPVFEDEYDQLDMSLNYEINDNFSVFLRGTNITDSKIHRYIGIPDATIKYRQTGPRYTLGIKGTF